MADKGKRIQAIGYLRTSSATNVGEGKDSEARQRKAIESFAKSAGYVIVDWINDAAVSGADPIETRPGFTAAPSRVISLSPTWSRSTMKSSNGWPGASAIRSRRRSIPMPLALTDAQLSTVTEAAALLRPVERDDFLRSVAAVLGDSDDLRMLR